MNIESVLSCNYIISKNSFAITIDIIGKKQQIQPSQMQCVSVDVFFFITCKHPGQNNFKKSPDSTYNISEFVLNSTSKIASHKRLRNV